jgi:hypothetical protein
MGRRLDNSDRGVLITVESARRIQDVVRKIEGGNRNTSAPALRTAFDEGEESVRLCKTTAKWGKGTEATLDVWEGGDPTEPAASDPAETVDAVNLFHDVDSGVYVLVARAMNGRWYLAEAGDPEDESSCKKPTLAGEDLTTLAGYDATKTQLLGHEGGCLKWIDTTECQTSPGGGA